MWTDVSNMDSLVNLVLTWLLTLEKQGCATMLQAGKYILKVDNVQSSSKIMVNDTILKCTIEKHPKELTFAHGYLEIYFYY